MDGNGHTRVDLEDGQWIEIRTRTNVGDFEHNELKRMERNGKTSPALTLIDTLERIVTAWSYSEEITPESIRSVLQPSALTAISGAIGSARPNRSALSSGGGGRKGKKVAT